MATSVSVEAPETSTETKKVSPFDTSKIEATARDLVPRSKDSGNKNESLFNLLRDTLERRKHNAFSFLPIFLVKPNVG